MTLYYHTEDDLVEVRPDILSYGASDLEPQMLESESIINRTIESRWYRAAAAENGLDFRTTIFDPALMLNGETQLKRLATYKSLQLSYLYLMKEAPEPDAFERQMSTFRRLYEEELLLVMGAGLDYDWDESGAIEAGENLQPTYRRLQRC